VSVEPIAIEVGREGAGVGVWVEQIATEVAEGTGR
jgi:hypothetical protein